MSLVMMWLGGSQDEMVRVVCAWAGAQATMPASSPAASACDFSHVILLWL
jgi:hypothetical protein